MTNECVYVIRDDATGLHKIGMTANWARRSKELQVGKTTTAVRLVRCPDAMKWERVLHAQFKHKRIPQSEWFRVTEEEVMPKVLWLLKRVAGGQASARMIVGQWRQAQAGHYYRRRRSSYGNWYTQTKSTVELQQEAAREIDRAASRAVDDARWESRAEAGFWPATDGSEGLQWADQDPTLNRDKFLIGLQAFLFLAWPVVGLAGLMTSNGLVVFCGVLLAITACGIGNPRNR
jgi:Meiotically up-regulated gene 113